MISYRSLADLNRCIVKNIHRLPKDVGIIVGIPRSGLLAANMIALNLNLPLTDLEGFVEGRLLTGGMRLQERGLRKERLWAKRVLIVDDSVLSGETMRRARARIMGSRLEHEPLFLAVYATKDSSSFVDMYFEICPSPRVFEWNIFHHSILKASCMDIDGVLCRDPSPAENDDGPRYAHFLREVEPLYIPSVPIRALVTARLEKYRKLTEEWLERHGVRYEALVMLNVASADARRRAGCHASFKAEVFKQLRAALFIESDPVQAVEIARLAGKEVFCAGTREMIYPTFWNRAGARLKEGALLEKCRPRRVVSKLTAAWASMLEGLTRNKE